MKTAYYETIVGIVLLVLLFMVPFLLPYYEGLVLEILILGTYAAGYNLAFGHTGILSLGHGVFFGLAGYVGGMLVIFWDPSLLSLLIGIVAGTMAAFVIGWAVFTRLPVGVDPLTKTLLVVIVTISTSMIIYYLFLSPFNLYTGGNRALIGITRQPLHIIDGIFIDLHSHLTVFYLVTTVGVMCLIAMRKIISSPFGDVIHGIRENELRVAFLGHNVFRIKVALFTLSGFFSAIAGVLFILAYGVIDLSVFSLFIATEIVAVCLIGGRKSFYGPLLGAVIFYGAKDIVGEYTTAWLLIVAVVLVITVAFMRGGIIESVARIRKFK